MSNDGYLAQVNDKILEIAQRMEMPPHSAEGWTPKRADPAEADMAYLAGVTEQCIVKYGSYQCEREDGHPLPHRAHIKTEWRG